MATNGNEIQIEQGEFTRVHNAIFDALSKARLSGAEFRCVLFLFRKTYGWNKKEDIISLSQWADGTDSKRQHVLKPLKSLIEKKIIYKRFDKGQIPTYGFNKYIEQWIGIESDSERGERFNKSEVLPKQVTVTKAGNRTVTKTGNTSVTQTGNNKRHVKDILKDNVSEHKFYFGELAKICKLDMKLKAGQIGKTAKALIKAEYSIDDLKGFEAWWYKNDFRGQKNEPPTLQQTIDKIYQYKAEHEKIKPKNREIVKGDFSNYGDGIMEIRT